MNDYLPLIKNGFGYYKIIDNNTVFHSISFNNSKLKLILSIPKGKDNTGFETADDKGKQTILTDILTGNNHKGYQIITGLEAYEQSLIIEKKFFEGLFKKQLKNIGKGLSESPPDKSFQLLVKWFDSNFNKAYEEYRNNLHDKKEDSKHHFRLYFIERMIEKRKKDFEKGDYSNEEKITNQKFINYLLKEGSKENSRIESPLFNNRFKNFEDAKNWFLKNYELENNVPDRINYLKAEIERTEKSLSSLMSLTQYDLLEGENREYYEGGKKYRDYLHSLLEEIQPPTNTNTMNGLGLTEKIKWLGGKDDFVELLMELIEKKYVENFTHIDLKKYVSSLYNSFDFSHASKKPESNNFENLYQNFKVEKRTQIIKKKADSRKFNEIKENNYKPR